MSPNAAIRDFAQRVFEDLSKMNEVDQLEIYCSHNQIRALRIVNTDILESKLNKDSGIGVRVLKSGFIGYASRTSLTIEAAREAYRKATKVANSKVGEKENVSFAKPPDNRTKKFLDSSFSDERLRNLKEEELAELGKRMIDSALARDNRVHDCSGSMTVVGYEFAITNSNGVDSHDMGGHFYATLTSMTKDGDLTAQGFDTLVTRKYSKLVDGVEHVGEKSAEMSVESLGPKQPSSGRYDIIYTPSCMSLTMRNLAGMANARRVHDGLSMFTEFLGKQVASDVVNVVEDGRFEDGKGSASVDDEGLPTGRTVIIENGLLKSFFHDSYTATKFGVQSTGNGFRVLTQVGGSTLEGKRYDFPPTCSSANFVILPGDSTEEEIIQDTKRGIILGWTRYERLLNSRAGAFTSNARSGNLMVENGEVKYPVYGFRIHDNYMNVLKSIDRVGKNLEQKGHWGTASISPTFRTRGIQIISI
nr:TldD/PmbA family protein [Candidatus Njordarchaeum guaymaensis]